jgi:hypothetical protein
MPPSLLPVELVSRAICPKLPASHTPSLTLALSPRRGNRFVDADSMLQLYDSLKRLRGRFEHNNQPYS